MTRFFGGDQRASNFARINRMIQPRPTSATFWTTSMSNSTTSYENTGGPAGIPTPWIKCLRVAGASSGYATLNQNLLDKFPVVPGKFIVASGYVFFTRAPTARVAPFVTWYDAAGVQVGQTIPTMLPGPINTWQRIYNVFTPPAGAALARLGFSLGLVDAWVTGDYWGVGGIMVEDGTALRTYFDGGNGGGMWSGVANESESWRNDL